MNRERPILISVMQYLPHFESGALSIAQFVDKARDFGVDGVELRREAWPAYQRELPAVRKQIEDSGLLVTYATFSTLFNADDAAHQLMLEDVRTAAALGTGRVGRCPRQALRSASASARLRTHGSWGPRARSGRRRRRAA